MKRRLRDVKKAERSEGECVDLRDVSPLSQGLILFGVDAAVDRMWSLKTDMATSMLQVIRGGGESKGKRATPKRNAATARKRTKHRLEFSDEDFTQWPDLTDLNIVAS